MKQWSIKTKIALWFTLILFLISLLACGAGLMVSDYFVTEKAWDKLELYVSQKVRKAESSNLKGELDWLYEDDVMYFIYDNEGKRIAGEGRISSDALKKLDQKLLVEDRKYYWDHYIELEQEKFLIYELKFIGFDNQQYWLRGIVYLENFFDIWNHISNKKQFLFPIFILFLFISFLGGRWLTGCFLIPIKKILQTAKEIQESGDLSKRICLNNNGDELHELAANFDHLFECLEKNFQAEKQFTSNVSHELRTPIAVILAHCEYALENGQSEEELIEALSFIQNQGYKISHLVEALLLLTRMEQQTERYLMSAVNISKLIQEICEDYCLFHEKGITLAADIEPNIVIDINRELFSLMISNLIRNAYKYGKENGHIWISLKSIQGYILFKVIDDGIGISDQDLTHIWERFYRADKSRHSSGLGLGLALVKQIAEFHRGTITVESSIGKGSNFCISFYG